MTLHNTPRHKLKRAEMTTSVPAAVAPDSADSDRDREDGLKEWVLREFMSSDHANARDVDVAVLRNQLKAMSRRYLSRQLAVLTVAERWLLEYVDHETSAEPERIEAISIYDLCKLYNTELDGVACTVTTILSAAMELSLLLRVAACLGVNFTGFKLPTLHSETANMDFRCSHVVIMALLVAGRRLPIQWTTTSTNANDIHATACQVLCGLRDRPCPYDCGAYGLTGPLIVTRIVNVIGERGAFFDRGLAQWRCRTHPVLALASFGLRHAFRAFECDDASPYRYVPDGHSTQDDVKFALQVNARRDEYRGVLRRMPLLAKKFTERLFSGVVSSLWPIVLGYLFSSELYASILIEDENSKPAA